MPTILKTKNSVTTTVAPTTLQQGELAVNITDKKMWVGNAATTPVLLLNGGPDGVFTSITDSGNLTFTGTGNRITGDFSNATLANTVIFQSSSTNGGTTLSAIPNGASATAQIRLINSSSDLVNHAYGLFRTDASAVAIYSAISGTGTYLPLTMLTGGSERLRIDTSGNVGIGTSTIVRKLDVRNTSADYQLHLGDTASTTLGYELGRENTGGLFKFYGNQTGATGYIFSGVDGERMRIDSSGNVGIGTSSPTAVTGFTSGRTVLQVTNTADGSAQLRLGSGSGTMIDHDNSGQTITTIRNLYGVSSTTALMQLQSGYLTFGTGTSYTERMRISSSGNVSIGTSNFGGKLYVTNAVNDHCVRFDTDFNNFTSVNVFSVLFGTNTNTTSCNHFNGYADGANRILIYGNGNIQNQNNSYAGISDIKLKENVTDTAPKLDKLNQVRVVNYNLKDNPDQKLLGVVAQELEQIFPNMVEETADKDVDGNDLGTTTKSVKYSVFVPMLIKAMQEQQAIIENLTTRLTALESK
jgi:hypothetical protein